jgi:hypothetical protein
MGVCAIPHEVYLPEREPPEDRIGTTGFKTRCPRQASHATEPIDLWGAVPSGNEKNRQGTTQNRTEKAPHAGQDSASETIVAETRDGTSAESAEAARAEDEIRTRQRCWIVFVEQVA